MSTEQKITLEQYKNSVKQMLNLCNMRCGASRVAAQVLLSAYNGDDYQLDICALSLLDRANNRHAITVIRGRVELYIEPHELIDNGSEIFRKLCKEWSDYHVDNRSQRPALA